LNISRYFSNIFEYFQTFSNVFERFQNKLAHLMRKSALLIEILTHLRINLRACPVREESLMGFGANLTPLKPLF